MPVTYILHGYLVYKHYRAWLLFSQMDMIHEARCLKRFHADFADVMSVRIPVPVMSLVRRNILVESFEVGKLWLSYSVCTDISENYLMWTMKGLMYAQTCLRII